MKKIKILRIIGAILYFVTLIAYIFYFIYDTNIMRNISRTSLGIASIYALVFYTFDIIMHISKKKKNKKEQL